MKKTVYNTLTLYRVPYGSPKTSRKDREYRLDSSSPVGTIAEWKKAFPDKNFIIVDKTHKKKMRRL